MKSLIVALTMVATSAFANSTVMFPKYDGVSANLLCDAGSSFQTINPIAVCDVWKEIPGVNGGELYSPSEWVCEAAHYEHVSVSKVGTTCVKYGTTDIDAAACLEQGPYNRPSKVIATNYNYQGEASIFEDFWYTIPACAKTAPTPKPVSPKKVK